MLAGCCRNKEGQEQQCRHQVHSHQLWQQVQVHQVHSHQLWQQVQGELYRQRQLSRHKPRPSQPPQSCRVPPARSNSGPPQPVAPAAAQATLPAVPSEQGASHSADRNKGGCCASNNCGCSRCGSRTPSRPCTWDTSAGPADSSIGGNDRAANLSDLSGQHG